jgi:hypothetical protein
VAALTQGTGRRRWRDQIPGEGRRSDGGDGQKGNGGGGLLIVRFKARTEEGKERGAAASSGPIFKRCRRKQRKGGGNREGPWCDAMH